MKENIKSWLIVPIEQSPLFVCSGRWKETCCCQNKVPQSGGPGCVCLGRAPANVWRVTQQHWLDVLFTEAERDAPRPAHGNILTPQHGALGEILKQHSFIFFTMWKDPLTHFLGPFPDLDSVCRGLLEQIRFQHVLNTKFRWKC